jgi:hypothetical protein
MKKVILGFFLMVFSLAVFASTGNTAPIKNKNGKAKQELKAKLSTNNDVKAFSKTPATVSTIKKAFDCVKSGTISTDECGDLDYCCNYNCSYGEVGDAVDEFIANGCE